MSKDYGKDVINSANIEIEKIAKRTCKPIMNACISKNKDGGYDSLSVEFTGEQIILNL